MVTQVRVFFTHPDFASLVTPLCCSKRGTAQRGVYYIGWDQYFYLGFAVFISELAAERQLADVEVIINMICYFIAFVLVCLHCCGYGLFRRKSGLLWGYRPVWDQIVRVPVLW